MKYSCNYCYYNTGNKSNYNKHLTSKIHIEKVNNCSQDQVIPTLESLIIKMDNNKQNNDILVDTQSSTNKSENKKNDKFKCKICNIIYESRSGLYKHAIKCNIKSVDNTTDNRTIEEIIVKKENNDLKQQIFELQKRLTEKENNDLKQQVIELQKRLSEKDNDIQFLKDVTTKAGSITNKTLDVAKQSMSALSYLQTYCNNAPPIEAPKQWLPEYKKIGEIKIDIAEDEEYFDEEYHKAEKRREITSKIDTRDEDNFVKDLIRKQDILNEYLGKMIISFIKKDNPTTQSLWCSDVARLSYLVKDIIDKNENISEWKVDKKGSKVNDVLIKPLLKEIIILTKECMQRSFQKIAMGKCDSYSLMMFNEEIAHLLDNLYNKTMTNQIKKYVATELFLNKKDELIEDK